MRMTEKEFKKYLLIYGANPDLWPEALRFGARRLQQRYCKAWKMAKHRYLEQELRALPFEEASPFLADRIAQAASKMPQDKRFSLGDWLRGLFTESSLPNPAYAIMLTLLLGFSMGVSGLGLADSIIADTPQPMETYEEGVVP